MFVQESPEESYRFENDHQTNIFIRTEFKSGQNSNVRLNFNVEVSYSLLSPHSTLIIFSVFIYFFHSVWVFGGFFGRI